MNTNLENKVIEYQKKGWILITQSNAVAQLRKPKESPSCLIAGIFFLLGIVPGIVYLLAYAVKKEQTITLAVDEAGKIRVN